LLRNGAPFGLRCAPPAGLRRHHGYNWDGRSGWHGVGRVGLACAYSVMHARSLPAHQKVVRRRQKTNSPPRVPSAVPSSPKLWLIYSEANAAGWTDFFHSNVRTVAVAGSRESKALSCFVQTYPLPQPIERTQARLSTTRAIASRSRTLLTSFGNRPALCLLFSFLFVSFAARAPPLTWCPIFPSGLSHHPTVRLRPATATPACICRGRPLALHTYPHPPLPAHPRISNRLRPS